MANNNTNKMLTEAKKTKKDEFYTRLEDIEKELCNYKNCFKNKVVFCNCDDPYESNFFKYFALNFNALGLKKMICTCYAGSPIITEQLSLFDVKGLVLKKEDSKKPYKIEICSVHDFNKDGAIDLIDIKSIIEENENNSLSLLKGNGDFRSDECVELLKESDIVVTNPPFSLFREFISLINQYNKDFVLISNINALTYKDVFKMFMEDKIRTGYTNFNVGMYFSVPDNTPKFHRIENGKKFVRVASSCWLTSLPVEKHNDYLILYKEYSEEKYPKLQNCKGINVETYNDIPDNYFDYIAVPITFLDKYNPNQFKIVGSAEANILPDGWKGMTKEFVDLYYKQGNTGSIRIGNRLTCCISSKGIASIPYKRVIIIRKRNEVDENV